MSSSLNSKLVSKSYPFRPQRYHAWDVAETHPHVLWNSTLGSTHDFAIINFSEQGLCIEADEKKLPLKSGDILSSLQIIFNQETLLSSKAKIKHVTRSKDSTQQRYGLRLLDTSLDIAKVFSLRNQAQQDSSQNIQTIEQKRSPRLPKEAFNSLEIHAAFQQEDIWIDVEIENVSAFGFCLKLPHQITIDNQEEFQPGATLKKFRFCVAGRELFFGDLRIIHCQTSENHWRLGTFCLGGQEVLLSGIHSALKLKDLKAGFNNFLAKTQKNERIHPDFKLALNDFRYFLEATKSYLEEAEKQIGQLASAKERTEALEAIRDFSERKLAKKVKTLIKNMEKVVTTLNKQDDEIHRKYFQEQMLDLTNGCLVFRRALEKPLGYAGDFELMNSLYHRTQEGRNLWERVINSCFNHLEPAQAVRNRAIYLEKKLAELIQNKPDQSQINILSLACGPCEEIQRYLQRKPRHINKVNFYLLDQEEQAIHYAQQKLYPLASTLEAQSPPIQFSFYQHGVKNLLKEPEVIATYPKMDFVYSAGLFDYLPAPIAKRLTQVLLTMLKPQGKLIIGNFQKDHPNYFVETYFSDWFLILRSQQEIFDFLPNPNWQAYAHIEAESTNTNLFLNVEKPSQNSKLMKENFSLLK